jgi:predicted permease
MLMEFLRRAWYLLNRRRFDDALRREMEAHRAMMDEPIRFGNPLRLREEARDVWGWAWLDDVMRDVRFAWRTLRRTPGVTAIAVCSLALATGATTAIFSVINAVVLRPLPFPEPHRLVQVYGREWREDRGGSPDPVTGPVGWPELEAYGRHATTFEGFAGYEVSTRHLDGASGPERLTAVAAELSFFEVLGVETLVGRPFRSGDSSDVAVISARLWSGRFGADRSLAGKRILLDGRPFTVVGVMPGRFQFPYRAGSLLPGALPYERTDVWVPLPTPSSAGSAPRRRGRLSVIARLRPEIPAAAGESELRRIAAVVAEQYSGTRVRVDARVVPLTDVVTTQVRGSLWLLFAAVGLVLATACANVANLLLARMAVRSVEVATRAALGASSRRLRRQFLAESLLLAVAGASAGVLLARWGLDVLVAYGAAKIPRAHEIGLDWTTFAFLLIVCVATALLFGIAPALAASRVDPYAVTKGPGGHAGTGGRLGRLRDTLVAVEVALAFVLALGAGLVIREVVRLRNLPMGMTTENVLTLHLTPRATAPEYYAIEERVQQLPGVRAAGVTQLVPLQNWGWTADFAVRGQVRTDRMVAGLRYVTPGYFRALGIATLNGRTFTSADTDGAPPVVVVNEELVRRYLPGQDPVGLELDRGRIIGVVASVRQQGLDRPPEPEIYYPAAQNLTMAADLGMSLVVRAARRPEPLTDAIRATVRDVNPRLAIFNVKPMERVVADSLWELNLYRWLIGSFAALALVLAALGLYAVVSYAVTSRVREFALRLALGADRARVSRLVLGRALRLAGVGLCAGTLLALGVSTFVWTPPAPVGLPLYAAVTAVLLTVAAVASLVPALRIGRVDPATALRHE